MYRRIEDFVKDFAFEREATIKVLKNLTDDSLDVRATELSRSISRLASHISAGISSMVREAKLPIEPPVPGAPDPTTVADLVAAYEAAADAVVEVVKSGGWTNDMMENELKMFGQMWNIGTVLSVTLFHQCHHRGQLTMLMRQAGLTVPGVYGPSREEWVAFGMEAPR